MRNCALSYFPWTMGKVYPFRIEKMINVKNVRWKMARYALYGVKLQKWYWTARSINESLIDQLSSFLYTFYSCWQTTYTSNFSPLAYYRPKKSTKAQKMQKMCFSSHCKGIYLINCIMTWYSGFISHIQLNQINLSHGTASDAIRVRVQLDSPILWIDMYIPSADAWHRQRRELCH
jgi:hypothetical protein